MKSSPLLTAASFVGSLIGCNLIITQSAAQCARNEDCEARFPNAGLVCERSSCVERLVEQDSGTDAAPVVECSSNLECMQKEAKVSGEPAICVKHKCQTIRFGNNVCTGRVLPVGHEKDLEKDDVVLLAGFVHTDGNPLATPIAQAYGLALEELLPAGGLPKGKNGDSRPVVMALCAIEEDRVESAVAHVTQDLEVPALLATFSQANMFKFFQDYASKKNVLVVNPQDTTILLDRNQNVDSLLWHLLGTPEDLALAHKPLMNSIEPYVRTLHGKSDSDPIKVAVVISEDETEQVIANTIQKGPFTVVGTGIERDATRAVRFNGGKSTADNGGNFRTFPLTKQGVTAAVIEELKHFVPDVLIALTSRTELDALLPLDAAIEPAKRPLWVLSVSNSFTNDLIAHLSSNDSETASAKRKRFLGIQYAGSTEPKQRDEWIARMKARYDKEKVPSETYSNYENFYDAVYWITYGLYAAGAGVDASGPNVRAGIKRLTEAKGPRIYPGDLTAISNAFLLMDSPQATRFVGALGPLEIDLRRGVALGTGSLYCYQLDETNNQVTVHYDVRRYNHGTMALDVPQGGSGLCTVGFPPP